MKKMIFAALAAAILLSSGNAYAAQTPDSDKRLYPVVPNPIADAPNIVVINDRPELEIFASLKRGEWPDEFVIVGMMQSVSEAKLSPKSTPIFLSSKWRLNLFDQMIEGGQKRGIYNNAQLLEEIVSRWQADDYTQLERDNWLLEKMLDLHHETFD